MASHSLGLTLYDAARQMGVSFAQENEAADRVIQLDGMNFHYLEWGDPADPTILMLHGNSQQAHSWDFVSLALSNRYHSIVLDQRGHGDSDWAPDGDYSVEAQQKDLDAFVEALGLDNFNLIGHSMGGRNAYVWASRHPDKLKSLVIVDTGPETQRRGQDRMRRFRELPDELDTFEEFVLQGAGIYRPQRGADAWRVEVQHPAARRRQVDLEVRQGHARPGRPTARLDPGAVVGLRRPDRLPHAGAAGGQKRPVLRRDDAADAGRDSRLFHVNHTQRRPLGPG